MKTEKSKQEIINYIVNYVNIFSCPAAKALKHVIHVVIEDVSY